MTMQVATNGQANVSNGEMMERVIALGDLEQLRPMERAQYYVRVCESVGLNPLTKPFAYIKLNGKLTLYALRDCTDQLRKIHSVSVRIVSREMDADGVYTITARATMSNGREDESTGCVHIAGLKGENLANAKMKAETKAKRRVTLSICGLGWLDETEVADVRGAKFVDVTTEGEIVGERPVAAEKPAGGPDLTQQLQASVSKFEWDKWAAGHLIMIEEAQDKGMLNEAWAAVNEDRRRLKDKGTPVPDLHYGALTKAKDERKAKLS